MAVPAPTVLPRLSTFVGRKKELAELRRLLHHTRILALLGPGGCGKTRLATELALQKQSRFADGSILVDLASVSDPDLVADAVARAASIKLERGDQLAALGLMLRNRRLLVVMDNCEHLIEPVARLIVGLLPQCPHMVVVATSRERLDVEGEIVWRVPPMGLPSEPRTGDAALTADAVRLFVDRARCVRTDFAATSSNADDLVAICRRLDGMPLAIELAAARVGTLSPAEILPRLEDRFRLLTQGGRNAPTRQRTLRATIDWSFELLDETERVLLRRLSVFAGDFGPESAQDICSLPPLDGSRVLDALGGLVDKSMVQAGPGPDPDGTTRHRLLETIRAYAVERLEESQEARAIRDRHLDFYTRLAVTAEQRRRSHGAMAEHRRLWAEIADVRSALEWSHGDPTAELLLVASLRFVWWVYSPVEGLRRLGEVLARPRAAQAPGTRALAASTWSALSGRGGHFGDARWALQEVAELAAQAGDAFLLAHDPLGRGYLAERAERDLEKARHLIALAVASLERLETSPELAMAYCSLGGIEIQLANPGAAAPLVRRGLDLALALEDDFGAVGAYFTLGWLELERGALASARAAFMAGLDVAPEGDLVSIAHQVEGVACAAAPSDAVHALTLFGAAARMREEVAAPRFSHWRPWPERAIATARGALAPRKADEAWDNGGAMGPARVIALLRQDKGRRAGRLEGVPGPLSRRELEIAHLVSMGLTSRAIGERLFLAERTVESHLDHIMTKLDFGSRAQVAAWVAEQQLGDRGAEPGV